LRIASNWRSPESFVTYHIRIIIATSWLRRQVGIRVESACDIFSRTHSRISTLFRSSLRPGMFICVWEVSQPIVPPSAVARWCRNSHCRTRTAPLLDHTAVDETRLEGLSRLTILSTDPDKSSSGNSVKVRDCPTAAATCGRISINILLRRLFNGWIRLLWLL
jgi:hypothetical protein